MKTATGGDDLMSGFQRCSFTALLILGIGIQISISCKNPEAGIASITGRVKTYQRDLAKALEQYYAEYNFYPTTLDGLTTPTAYVTSIPPDDLSPRRKKANGSVGHSPMSYFSDRYIGYIVWSTGPDKDHDLNNQNISRLYDPEIAQPSATLLLNGYDPSNGVISNGDIFRVKQ